MSLRKPSPTRTRHKKALSEGTGLKMNRDEPNLIEPTSSNDLEGYSTPNDFKSSSFLPSSPADEDEDYLDYVLSDEELGEMFVDDDDEDDDLSLTQRPPAGGALADEEESVVEDDDDDDDDAYADDESEHALSPVPTPMKLPTSSKQRIFEALSESPFTPRRLRRRSKHHHASSVPDIYGDETNEPRRTHRARAESLPAPFFRYIRNLGKPDVPTLPFEELMEDDASDGGEQDEDGGFEYEQQVDFDALPPLPDRFINSTGRFYLDPSLISLTVRDAQRFANEQGLFLQAVLQLLAERDQVGVEGDIHSQENIFKKGPLKKLSKGKLPNPAWKVKYVELRQGNLCYYEDDGQRREVIHLRQADTVAQESLNHKGFVFELLVQGSPARYWMASSEEERSAWLKAIHAAMIGTEGPRRELDLTPHQESLSVYQSIQSKIAHATSREEYIAALPFDTALQVPIEWIRDRKKKEEASAPALPHLKQNKSAHKQLKTSISDFWNRLSETSFAINGIEVLRTTPLASARVMGALTRCILEHDKAFVVSSTAGQMTELQAVSYARNILLTVLRSREQDDASVAIEHLLKSDLVEFKRKRDEEFVVNIEVSFAGEELPDEFLPPISDEMVGWVGIRRSKQPIKMSKKRYVVLSGSVFSYYEEASPRPIGLRGQLMLGGATLKELPPEMVEGEGLRFVLSLSPVQEPERILTFDSEEEMTEWKEAMQVAIDSCPAGDKLTENDLAAGSTHTAATVGTESRRMSIGTIPRSAVQIAEKVASGVIKGADGSIRGSIRVIKGAKDGGVRVIKNAKDVGIKVIRTGTDGSIKVLRGAAVRLRSTGRGGTFNETDSRSSSDLSLRSQRRPSMHMLLNNTTLSGKRDEPTVQCVFQETHSYWVNAKDELQEERWLKVNAKLYQAFLLMGGPSGRMARGDALIELEFADAGQHKMM